MDGWRIFSSPVTLWHAPALGIVFWLCSPECLLQAISCIFPSSWNITQNHDFNYRGAKWIFHSRLSPVMLILSALGFSPVNFCCVGFSASLNILQKYIRVQGRLSSTKIFSPNLFNIEQINYWNQKSTRQSREMIRKRIYCGSSLNRIWCFMIYSRNYIGKQSKYLDVIMNTRRVMPQ